MDKRCLIIDNEDQSSNIETIVRQGKSRGISITCDEYNVGMINRNDLLTDNKIDMEKVIRVFKQQYKKNTYHLAAFDWDLGDDSINGVELIRKFQENRILVNTPKILYSGLLKTEISTMLNKYKNNELNETVLVNWINTLVRADIVNYVDRTNYEQEIITQLSKTDETLDLIIEEELKRYPSFIFKNSFGSKNFNGKTFLEISNILDIENSLRNEFKKEIILQVISYLTESLNSDK